MASESLFASAPSFDQPLAVLKHCHDRIRKQLATLDKLQAHLQQHGADEQAQQAALAILRYFIQAAPLHHEDEEHDLFPALQSSVNGDDKLIFEQHLATILQQHQVMAGLWDGLRTQLQAISNGEAYPLDAELIQRFKTLYVSHMELEETQIAPLAARTLNAEQFANMSQRMQQRRGIEAR